MRRGCRAGRGTVPGLHQVGLQRLGKAHNPARAIEDIDYFCLRTGFDFKAQTLLNPLPTYQGLPGILIHPAQQQKLHATACRDLASVQAARRDNAPSRSIRAGRRDAGSDPGRERWRAALRCRPAAAPAGVKRRVGLGRGLCDPVWREVMIEIGCLQGDDYLLGARRTTFRTTVSTIEIKIMETRGMRQVTF